jgi:hypothetical integral membrane protein (TIGR02206 family)
MTDLFADFFAETFQGPAFEALGTHHLAALGALLLLNLFLLLFRKSEGGTKGFIRFLLALVLIGSELAWHYWNYIYGRWTIQTMLPLSLRSFLVWIGAWMLLTKSYKFYELAYFVGIVVGIWGLAMPELGEYNFPHFLFFHYFISYGLILTSALYMTVVQGLRPTVKSMLWVFIKMNIFAGIVYYINTVIGSNYLGVNSRPDLPSQFAWLPEWPMYIVYMELIGIAVMLLLYLPFAAKDLINRYFMNRDNASRLESISK